MVPRSKSVIAVTAVLILVVAGILVSTCQSQAHKKEQEICRRNLKTVYSAVLSHAFANRCSLGTSVPQADVLAYVVPERRQCPHGKTYSVPLVGRAPVCPYHGNLLAGDEELRKTITPRRAKLWAICKVTAKKGLASNVPQDILEYYDLTVESLDGMLLSDQSLNIDIFEENRTRPRK